MGPLLSPKRTTRTKKRSHLPTPNNKNEDLNEFLDNEMLSNSNIKRREQQGLMIIGYSSEEGLPTSGDEIYPGKPLAKKNLEMNKFG